MTKRDERLRRAAAARALLGLEDENEHDRVSRDAAPVSAGSGDVGTGVRNAGNARGAGQSARGNKSKRASVQARDIQPGEASFERPDVQAELPDSGVEVSRLIAPGLIPKKHKPGDLKRCDSVWYHGERYFVEWAPSKPGFADGTHARISSKPVRGEPFPLPSDTNFQGESFCVHMDALDLAPPVTAAQLYKGDSTMAAAVRKERAAKGLHDVGDEVATLLRESKDIYKTGSDYLQIPIDELKRKYGHLNAGQQRMNIGNRMRARWKKTHGKG